MVDAADVLVDRVPPVDDLAVPGLGLVVRVAEAQEVPRRVDEGVHRLDLAPAIVAADRARRAHPLLGACERCDSLGLVVLDVRQQDRQLVLRHGDGAVLVAVDDRDRAAPVALAREAPVAETKADRGLAAAALAEPVDDRTLRFLRRPPVELRGVDEHAVVVDHRDDRQVELLGERGVAVVVRRHRHDRAGAVVHQHVVGDPDRDLRVVHRVRRVEPGEDAGLLLCRSTLLTALDGGSGDVVAQRVGLGRALEQLLDERVLRSEHEERRAVERVGTRREDGDVLVELGDPELDLGALRAADPVALHRLDAVGPLDLLQVVEQFVGVRRRLEEPLVEVLRHDLGAAVLAAPVVHLLVRQHDLVDRAPLDGRALPVREPRAEQLQEEPLVPAVVLGLVGRDQAIPVESPAHPLHRRDDVRDVAVDDRARVPALADRGVLGGQAERVEAHRMHHVHAVPPAEPREDVADRVDEDVPHVQRPGRVRPHLEHVALVAPVRLRLRIRDVEGPCVLPDALPLRLDRLRVVPFHPSSRDKKASRKRGRGEPTRRCRAYLPDLRKQPLHRRSMLAIPGCWSYSHIRPVSRAAS